MSDDLTPIRVVVVDDHDLLREGVSACLASFSGIDVVGEAPSGEAAVVAVDQHRPDVVVMDLVMPGIGGLEAIRRIRDEHSALGIVALSSFSDNARVRETVDAGATSYLIKSVDADSLARAVRDAANGIATFSPEVTLALVAGSAGTDTATATAALTARELQIAELMAAGRTNADIADELVLSVFTVKNHVSSILMKLNVRTRTEAAAVLHSRS